MRHGSCTIYTQRQLTNARDATHSVFVFFFHCFLQIGNKGKCGFFKIEDSVHVVTCNTSIFPWTVLERDFDRPAVKGVLIRHQ